MEGAKACRTSRGNCARASRLKPSRLPREALVILLNVVFSVKFLFVKTLTVDAQKRVRLPDAKPRQVFSYNPGPDGSVLLVPVVGKKRREPFPPGSLLKYFTREKNQEELALLTGCSLEVPE